MKMQSRLLRIVTSQLALWVVVLFVGAYYMVSFDKKTLAQAAQQSGVSVFKKYFDAFRLSFIKKGIDLEGGTYLVLSVEIEKALENRLAGEGRGIEALFKNKDQELPVSKEVKDLVLEMSFADEAVAKKAYAVLADARNTSLKFKLVDNVLMVSLAPEVEASVRTGAVEQSVNVLTNRLGGYGVEGIVVQQHGERNVVVQLPGIDDPERVKSVITKTAHLEFKIVEKSSSSRQSLLDDYDGDLPSDRVIVPGRREGDAEEAGRWYLVSAFPDLTGDHIISAGVDRDEYNRAVVTFKLDGAGGREFAELTANNVGKNLGIIIDNVMITAPVINQEISGGSGIIQGISSAKEAVDLSVVLRAGSLHAPLKIENENRVGASLGQDSINKGILSCVVALLLLFLFSLLYYKIPGFLAVLALFCNIFLTLLILSYLRATLTLPGIAGIVLTLGMAIDASILIYERIKEDLSSGNPLRKSILDGFSGVMAVIMDSNITTFLTGMVLYNFGGPAIKGFAVTLMVGIVATVLAGVFFLKALFLFLTDVMSVKRLKF